MTLGESCNEHEHLEDSAVRRNNRVLRRLTSTLRRRIETGRSYTDQLFIELCATSPAAELAFGELWGSAVFDCGPQDYEFMVEQSIAAIRKLREIEGHTNSEAQAEIRSRCCDAPAEVLDRITTTNYVCSSCHKVDCPIKFHATS